MAGKRYRRNNLLKFKKHHRASVIIFSIVVIYVIAFAAIYFSKAKIRTYEVYAGSLTSNNTYTALALRTEKVFPSSFSGNINYYLRESVKAKVGDTIYTVDETGRVAELLSQINTEGNALSEENLKIIKSTLNSFKTSYSGNNFSSVYDLKTDLNSTVLQSMNENIMSNLDSIINSTGSQNLFQTISTDTSGVVLYYTDGFEETHPDQVNAEMFKKEKYNKNNLKSEELVVANNPAYKMITSEEWNLMVPLTQEDIIKLELTDKKTVKIRFIKDNLTTTADFSIVNSDGQTYGKINLSKYMIRYATERYLDIELMSSTVTGLKIPSTSIVDKEFYTIPKEYLTTGGNANTQGFICEYYNNGQLVTEFKEAAIYSTAENLCYVDTKDFTNGGNIVMPDSTQRYQIGDKATLKGVYCINTGYTIFKRIDILDENKEYCIVKKGLSYGISVYDRIILDGDLVSESQMIY